MPDNKSLWNDEQRSELCNRIKSLASDTQPLWGEMTVHEMLAHIGDTFRLVLGEIEFAERDRFLDPKRVEQILSQGLPNRAVKGPVRPYSTPLTSFQEDIHATMELIARALDDPTDISSPPHPLFGPLSREQWGVFFHLHLDHHLKQFGI